jgi:hypothetical protein
LTTTSSSTPSPERVQQRKDRLEKLIQISAHAYDLGLEFGESDAIGAGQIVLGIEAERAATADYLGLRGAALHLLGHYLQEPRPTAAEAEREQAQGQPLFLALWHALEDARLENWMVRRWPGMQRSFAARLLPNLGGGLLQRMPTLEQIEYGLYLKGRGHDSLRLRADVAEALEQGQAEIRAGASGLAPADSLQAMRSIYPILSGLLPRAERSLRRGGSKFLDEESGDAPQRRKRSMREGEGDGPPQIEPEDGLVELAPLGRQRELPEWYRPGSAPWFERGLGEKRVHPSAVRIDRQTIVDAPRHEAGEYRALWNEVQREAGYLLTRLLYLMQEQAYLRYGGHHRSGKLEMNKLWKQRRGDFRLFQRVIEGGRQEIAFSLLVDESASMGGQQKHRIAAKAAVLLGETLSRIDVPFEIVGYSTAGFEAQAALKLGLTPAYRYRSMRCTALEHRVYKSFDEPYRFVRTRLAGIQPRHNNWDEEHLMFAQRRLSRRQEATRVMVVLSDGQPNGNADHLIATVRRLERQGTTVIGIGIGADFVRQIYRDSIVVGDFRQLAQELMAILIRRIVDGSGRPAGEGEPSARGVDRLRTAIADPTRASRE